MKKLRIQTWVNYSALWMGLILILLTTTLLAQNETETIKPKKLCGGYGHFNFSAEQFNLKDLNNSLKANNYGSKPLNAASFGGGGMYVINNFLLGGGGAWLMPAKTTNTTNSVDLKGGYGYFNFGYLFPSGKHSFLAPCIGIGGGSYTMLIDTKNLQKDFTKQLNSPGGAISTELGGWMLNLQLSYQYFFSKANTEGFFIGIKGGYKYSPYDWKMSMNNNSFSNSPKINMNGLYITVILGGGSIIRN